MIHNVNSLKDLLPDTSAMQSRADAVFEALRRAVLEGHMAPGKPLRQENLAKEFGVSQITVRDALNRLITEGLAVREPYKGVRVIELSIHEMEEAYSMRAVLEGWAAELAAGQITASELAELRRLLPASYVSADPASVERARQGNRAFHEVIIHASRHNLLAHLLRDVWNRLDPMTLYGRTLPTPQGRELREQWGERDRQNHTALIGALEDHDGPRARQLVTDYVQEVWKVLAETLKAAADDPELMPD
jgi:DNA-binding GntR family transcriptional regulator